MTLESSDAQFKSETATEILQQLVKIESLSGAEDKLTNWICQWFLSRGIQAKIIDRNVIVFFKGVSDKALFVFNGHTDTVAAGDINSWVFPPVGNNAGVISEGRLYGLGASDMKASLAAFMVLANQYHKNPPPIDIVFAFVTEEETSGDGTRRFIQYFEEELKRDNYKLYGSIVGEPTSFKFTEIGNRGAYFFALEIQGESFHAAQVATRPPAVPEVLISAINEANSLGLDWKKRFTDPLLGEPALTVTGIWTSDSSPNQLPASATVRFDLRTTPELDLVVNLELESRLSKYGTLKLLSAPCLSAIAPSDAHILSAIRDALPQVEFRAARGGNDCGALIKAGIPAITFGPGLKEVIHCVDEYTEVELLEKAADYYSLIVAAFSPK